MFWPAALEEAK